MRENMRTQSKVQRMPFLSRDTCIWWYLQRRGKLSVSRLPLWKWFWVSQPAHPAWNVARHSSGFWRRPDDCWIGGICWICGVGDECSACGSVLLVPVSASSAERSFSSMRRIKTSIWDQLGPNKDSAVCCAHTCRRKCWQRWILQQLRWNFNSITTAFQTFHSRHKHCMCNVMGSQWCGDFASAKNAQTSNLYQCKMIVPEGLMRLGFNQHEVEISRLRATFQLLVFSRNCHLDCVLIHKIKKTYRNCAYSRKAQIIDPISLGVPFKVSWQRKMS